MQTATAYYGYGEDIALQEQAETGDRNGGRNDYLAQVEQACLAALQRDAGYLEMIEAVNAIPSAARQE